MERRAQARQVAAMPRTAALEVGQRTGFRGRLGAASAKRSFVDACCRASHLPSPFEVASVDPVFTLRGAAPGGAAAGSRSAAMAVVLRDHCQTPCAGAAVVRAVRLSRRRSATAGPAGGAAPRQRTAAPGLEAQGRGSRQPGLRRLLGLRAQPGPPAARVLTACGCPAARGAVTTARGRRAAGGLCHRVVDRQASALGDRARVRREVQPDGLL